MSLQPWLWWLVVGSLLFAPVAFLIWWRRVHDDHKDETRDRPPGKLAYSKNQTSVMVDFAKIIIPIVTAFFVIYAAALRSPQLQSANQMLFFRFLVVVI